MAESESLLPSLEALKTADTHYKPFPPFAEWMTTNVDEESWDRSKRLIEAQSQEHKGLLHRAREVAKRAAAVDTGALEGLYDVDEGFTISVAMQSGIWEAAFEKRQEVVRNLIEAQLQAYNEVIDLATGSAPFAEAWVRGLHVTLCEKQGKYWVQTDDGPQEQELPLGKYKRFGNHVLQPDSTIHSYAPVLATPGEMARLLEELKSKAFLDAHPILQAAYAHYAFVAVHPFADGNGRVARALASVYLYRGGSIPLMILMEHKVEYLHSLKRADAGDYQSFVGFVNRRSADAFRLVAQSLQAAKAPNATERAVALAGLYQTRGGYSHPELDTAGLGLLGAIQQRAIELGQEYSRPDKTTILVRRRGHEFPTPPPGMRNPVSPTELLDIIINALGPATASLTVSIAYHVPFDAGPDDEILVVCLFNGAHLRIRVADLLPRMSTLTRLAVATYLEEVFGTALDQVHAEAMKTLETAGYIRKDVI